MHAVRLQGVTKTYGQHRAVDQLDLEITEGAIYGFIGPNGSGKSTTLRMILGIIEADEGSIEVLGLDHPRTANDLVGYLPEERGLYRKMSVRRVIAYLAGLKGVPRGLARERGERWLERFELKDWGDKKVEALSKGMQQKVQFICTVICEPRLVILDEPFSGLDPVNLDVLREAITTLRDSGTTVIFSTHDMGKAEEMCDALCMIYRGNKVLDGRIDEIKAREGREVIRVATGLSGAELASMPGVQGLRDLGRMQELSYSGDPQRLLAELGQRADIRHFEIAQPSLHDIFVRIARPQTAEEAA